MYACRERETIGRLKEYLPTEHFLPHWGPFGAQFSILPPLQGLTPPAWKKYRSGHDFRASALQNVESHVLHAGAKREI